MSEIKAVTVTVRNHEGDHGVLVERLMSTVPYPSWDASVIGPCSVKVAEASAVDQARDYLDLGVAVEVVACDAYAYWGIRAVLQRAGLLDRVELVQRSRLTAFSDAELAYEVARRDEVKRAEELADARRIAARWAEVNREIDARADANVAPVQAHHERHLRELAERLVAMGTDPAEAEAEACHIMRA